MSAVHTFPRHMTNARGSSATSFLSEHAEIERIITHNFKANPHLHAKVFAQPFSPSEGKQPVHRSRAESQTRREFDGLGHRSRQATTSLQYPPKSPTPTPVVLSPTSFECVFFYFILRSYSNPQPVDTENQEARFSVCARRIEATLLCNSYANILRPSPCPLRPQRRPRPALTGTRLHRP